MKKRIPIPTNIVDKLMIANKRICSICNVPRKHVQIHHIDSDPSNNSIDNLTVLCTDCHSLVSSNQGFGRKYSQSEVTEYKRLWESKIKTRVHNMFEVDDLKERHYEESKLNPDEFIEHEYSLCVGDHLSILLESDELVDLIIIKSTEFDEWLENEDFDNYEAYYQDKYTIETEFISETNTDYILVVHNISDEDAIVRLDLSV